MIRLGLAVGEDEVAAVFAMGFGDAVESALAEGVAGVASWTRTASQS